MRKRSRAILLLCAVTAFAGAGSLGCCVMEPHAQLLSRNAAASKYSMSYQMAPLSEEYRIPSADWDRESYEHIDENPFYEVAQRPLSTFSIDVDTASYSNLRRMLYYGQLPPKGAVRIEEMVNYFDYEYGGPESDSPHPFAAHADVTACPWNDANYLLRVALKGKEIQADERPDTNLVFLLDVSGSMSDQNKLPLVRRAMKLLVKQLTGKDRVAIVVYAGSSGVVLPSTPGNKRSKIIGALSKLQAGGSTHGSAGIKLAYKVAQDNFIEGGVNRVILCTDGDFNVGVSSESGLVDLITAKAKSGVFLTVLGFGMGNYKDDRLESLADKGNGAYGYIDNFNEAKKLFVTQLSGTLVTIAKDVKIQIEFNPKRVAAYRLIGYENRILDAEDFNDDKKDAGEIGAGHTVTAFYEIVPAGGVVPTTPVDPLRYRTPTPVAETNHGDELLLLKLRYKQPDGQTSTRMVQAITDADINLASAPQDMKFAAAVAGFGMLLRESPHAGSLTYDQVLQMARANKGADRYGFRGEFIQLIEAAKAANEYKEVASTD